LLAFGPKTYLDFMAHANIYIPKEFNIDSILEKVAICDPATSMLRIKPSIKEKTLAKFEPRLFWKSKELYSSSAENLDSNFFRSSKRLNHVSSSLTPLNYTLKCHLFCSQSLKNFFKICLQPSLALYTRYFVHNFYDLILTFGGVKEYRGGICDIVYKIRVNIDIEGENDNFIGEEEEESYRLIWSD
jgi:hypothetical protein